MANLDAPVGLSPVDQFGGPYTGQTNTYSIPASDSTAVYLGDPVKLFGAADASGKYPGVIKATIGDVVVGIVTSVELETQESLTYRAASTLRYVQVCDDANAIFQVQSDDGGGNLAAVDIGLNASFLLGAGSTVSGLSGAELDTSTKNTTNTLDMQILRLVDSPNNAIGANADVLVRLNNHQFVDGVTGV